MLIKPTQVQAFIERPPPDLRALLLYGPDEGLVAERALTAVKAVAGDVTDPFRVVELSAAQVRDDPARLFDEAAALALTGGRRVVRLRGPGAELLAPLKRFLAERPGEALLVVETGELPRKAALVQLFEKADAEAACIACYRDEGRDLQRLISECLREAGLSVAPDALTYLAGNLGGDRQLTRRELEKLVLYMGSDGGRVELPDVQACVGDSAALSLDDLALAVGDGDPAAAERALQRAQQEGAAAIQVLRALQRHFQRLHLVAGQLSAGSDLDGALRRLRPPVFWKTAARFKAQARNWPVAWLARVLERLLDCEAACKRSGTPDETLVAALVLELTAKAPQRAASSRRTQSPHLA